MVENFKRFFSGGRNMKEQTNEVCEQANGVYKIWKKIGLAVLAGSVIGGFITSVLSFSKQEQLSSNYKVKMESKECAEGVLKTFETPNGEISYIVDEMAEKSIDEIIFYMERLNKKPIVIDDLMALYRVVDSNYDNQINLDETEAYKIALRSKYYDKSFERLKSAAEKRH